MSKEAKKLALRKRQKLTLTSVGPGLEEAVVVLARGTAGRLVSSLAGMTFTSSAVDCPAGKA